MVIRKGRLIIPKFEDIAGDQDDGDPDELADDPAGGLDDSPMFAEFAGVAEGFEPAYRQPITSTGAPAIGRVATSGGSAVCSRCHRPLTSPESIARGMGPRCADKI